MMTAKFSAISKGARTTMARMGSEQCSNHGGLINNNQQAHQTAAPCKHRLATRMLHRMTDFMGSNRNGRN